MEAIKLLMEVKKRIWVHEHVLNLEFDIDRVLALPESEGEVAIREGDELAAIPERVQP